MTDKYSLRLSLSSDAIDYAQSNTEHEDSRNRLAYNSHFRINTNSPMKINSNSPPLQGEGWVGMVLAFDVNGGRD